MSIEDVAQELYGLAPEDFTSARNARAKQAKGDGDADLAARVQALRKPTTGAWLLNQLVREHGAEVAQVLELGARLRAAQGTVGADELRGLDRERRRLTHAVAQQALALGRKAGRRVTDQVADAVEETLRSAMVDAAAGAALSTGLLTSTFSCTGIDAVDLSGVVALGSAAGAPVVAPPGTPVAASPEKEATADREATAEREHERALADARDALNAAESALQAAGEAVEVARARVADTRRERQVLEAEREEARRRVEELDGRLASAAAAEDAVVRDEDRATRDEAAALEVAERLRQEVEALLGSAGPGPV